MERGKFLNKRIILNLYYPESMPYLYYSHWSTENIVSTIKQGMNNSISYFHCCWIFENEEEKNGFALVLVISNSRGNILYNCKLLIYMNDWQFLMILLGVHNQVEIPFPMWNIKLNFYWECTTNLKFHFLLHIWSIKKLVCSHNRNIKYKS